uniref:Uncharacterized protein n=1 Tax=Arundo donax TaxID=35708 RepID=A0A0A9H9M5_ARUDO
MPPSRMRASDLAGSTLAFSSSVTTNDAMAVAARSCTSSCELFNRLSSSGMAWSIQNPFISRGLVSAIHRRDCDTIHWSHAISSGNQGDPQLVSWKTMVSLTAVLVGMREARDWKMFRVAVRRSLLPLVELVAPDAEGLEGSGAPGGEGGGGLGVEAVRAEVELGPKAGGGG